MRIIPVMQIVFYCHIFAALIKNSEFVLTDSYHATIFSLIFERYFLHLKRFNDNEFFCQNIRIESLLNYLELDDCIINKKSLKGEDGYKTFSIRIKDETVANLDKLAEQTNRSRNELINILLDYAIKNSEVK